MWKYGSWLGDHGFQLHILQLCASLAFMLLIEVCAYEANYNIETANYFLEFC
jgi:hypothetical protein